MEGRRRKSPLTWLQYVYVMLYGLKFLTLWFKVRSLNQLPPETFACLDRPETIQGTLASLLRFFELKILRRSPVVCWLL